MPYCVISGTDPLLTGDDSQIHVNIHVKNFLSCMEGTTSSRILIQNNGEFS